MLLNTKNADRQKNSGLEIVRGLAASLVVLNHIFLNNLLPSTPSIQMLTAFATEAVIIFFVLSGAVITLSVARKDDIGCRLSAIQFLQSRAIRIYPTLIIAITISVIVAFLSDSELMPVSTILGNLLFLQSLQGYIVRLPSNNLALWSLSYEMTFYILFALSLKYRNFIWAWVALSFGAAIFVSFRSLSGVAGHFIAVLSLAIPWLLGHFVAKYTDHLPRFTLPSGICFLSIGLLMARVQLTDFYDPFRLCGFALFTCPLMLSILRPSTTSFHGENIVRFGAFCIAALLLWTFSSSLLLTKLSLTTLGVIAVACPLSYLQALLIGLKKFTRAVEYLGSISYPVYAIHTPILFWVRDGIVGPAWVKVLIFLTFTWAISHCVERWLQPWIGKHTRTSPRSVPIPRGAT